MSPADVGKDGQKRGDGKLGEERIKEMTERHNSKQVMMREWTAVRVDHLMRRVRDDKAMDVLMQERDAL